MKKLLFFAALAAGLYYVWTRLSKKSDVLQDHLHEQAALQQIGQVSTTASMDSMPARQTVSSRGAMDGSALDVFASYLPVAQTWFMPTGPTGGRN